MKETLVDVYNYVSYVDTSDINPSLDNHSLAKPRNSLEMVSIVKQFFTARLLTYQFPNSAYAVRLRWFVVK
jgi:hypothetical protein